MKEADLQKAIGSLPRSMQPARDLWPGIAERLGKAERDTVVRREPRFWHAPALAAAVLMALVTGIYIGRGLDTGAGDQLTETVEEAALIGTVKATELEYQAAFSELVPLDYSGLRLNGEEPDALRGSWEALVQTETALLAALKQYPSDVYLNEKLMDLRSRQLQFVKQLALLEQNDWRRT
jgi:DNA-binding response OmpR family regulator